MWLLRAKKSVLIESDWNLKGIELEDVKTALRVLIESDWNLKYKYNVADSTEDWVLIESDWNLKIIQKASSMWTTRY